MSGYRKTTDPVVQSRLCNACRKPIVGITERGLTYWLDAVPCTHQVERIYHSVGRATYRVQPRPARAAWMDWRNPVTATRPPSQGLVLALHPHQDPGPRCDPPEWLVTDRRVTAVDEEPLF